MYCFHRKGRVTLGNKMWDKTRKAGISSKAQKQKKEKTNSQNSKKLKGKTT